MSSDNYRKYLKSIIQICRVGEGNIYPFHDNRVTFSNIIILDNLKFHIIDKNKIYTADIKPKILLLIQQDDFTWANFYVLHSNYVRNNIKDLMV